MTIAAASIEAAFRWACRLDVSTRKAGNVSLASAGHGMVAELFIASADAAAAALCEAGAGVGARIEAAVRASIGVAQCNTNLGIVLLCAPIAAACERPGVAAGDLPALRRALAEVMLQLDVADARAAYRAIALANPGGLGRAPAQDVAAAPTIGLREAMALAADRDRIAAQYVDGYALIFDVALPVFASRFDRAARSADGAGDAMLATFLTLLAGAADSHIVRKFGDAVAQTVIDEARPWLAALQRGVAVADDAGYAQWDASLKARAINPGTTADLCVATAMLARVALPAVAAPNG